MLHLTLKTVLLLAMATARRVSEIHAVAVDSEHLRFSKLDGSLSLRTQPGFYTPPHDSGGVLWFHVGRLCVCPSVRQSSVRPFFVSG